ncbi:MAG TPA: SH3 domain-containing protein [Usitatibacter sp.]|nr:SH3 domain-containing protein [Usitatibacter sp.]
MLRACCILLALAAPAVLAADNALVALGKARAATSAAKWEVRDLKHPVMGTIKAAIWLNAQSTDAGRDRIVSSIYLSCQKAADRIAIELANAPASNLSGGMGPMDLPQLTCVGLKPDGTPQRTELAASWEIDDFGDALSRGMRPGALRSCASIEVTQNLALPPGWPRASQRVSLEFSPYSRELDQVFSQCGEDSAYPEQVAAAPAARLALPAKAAAKPPAPGAPPGGGWKRARTVSKGKTNIRTSGSLDGALVTQLPPGMPVLVEPGSGDWWHVKPRSGSAYEGYVRRDRFVFD